MDWHPKLEHRILSGSYDKKILIWDINKTGMDGSYEPFYISSQSDGVEDVKWSTNENVFGSVGQDRVINL